MKNQQSKKYEGRKYMVVPHDPEWLVLIAKEAEDLIEIFGSDAIKIEHI
ncbi:MAG: hypothetical protein UZ21_OP11001000737 [Microgenomates bacterium OLB22]|nr:MAG: hypothetical protein UZ21_OP11001000737 [Microgenomates bacterium OLB22]